MQKITHEENDLLLARARAGEQEAEEELIVRNMGLVRSIVTRFRGRGCEEDDLIQIGTIGMLRAMRSFDFSRGVTFSTYAVPLIIGEIRRFLRDDGIIKVGRAKKLLGMQLYHARDKYTAEYGEEPHLSDIAKMVGVDVAEAATALDATAPVRSLSEPLSGGDDAPTLGELLTDGERDIERTTERIALAEAMRCLPPERRKIIVLRYFSGYSQERTAAELGLTQVKVSREEKRIIEFLRTELGESPQLKRRSQ